MGTSDLTGWLLEAQTPTIRYLTLTRLLGLDEQDAEVQAALAAMQTEGPIPAILAGQAADGSWTGENNYYTHKFFSSHWSMLLLAELHADPALPGVQRGAVSILERTMHQMTRPNWMIGEYGLTCFWANVLRYCLHAGLENDPRLTRLIEHIASDGIRFDWRCEYNGDKPCAWGAGRALWGLAALPAAMQTPEVRQAIDSAIHFLLEQYDPLQGNYPLHGTGKVSPLWSRLNFPLFYQADLLLVLRSLAELNRLEAPGAGRVLDWLAARRGPDGRWKGSSPFRQRTWRDMGAPEETHRWVSLQAALVVGV